MNIAHLTNLLQDIILSGIQYYAKQNMKFQDFIRIALTISLVSVLGWLTYLSITQLNREDTTVSQHFVEDGADFPSITICLKWLGTGDGHLSLPDSEDWTFEDYMDKVPDVKSIIEHGNFKDQPGDKFP